MDVIEVSIYESNIVEFCKGYVRVEARTHLTKCDIACRNSLPSLMCDVDVHRTDVGPASAEYHTYKFATSSDAKNQVGTSWYMDSEDDGAITLIDRYYVYIQ